ncbi:hypothetical protein OKA05_26025 [Luteolibacter arcticus]|uniref:Transmembrane protein n=1 Tax=Luteolibacter arcticus TaxID=1581411 RepID=A0ABT3GR92_9BACT|nr:hypothetical protein [Luteolibacter arcticus]MCW1926044.1 hypothetical protein [Luteolibacter arcticus]
MTTPGHLNRTRAANHRRAWIGFGAALLVCSAFGYWVVSDDSEDRMATVRRAHPGVTICFAADPLQEIKLWVCGINAMAAIGIIVRGLLIRLPAA